jgi:hypothetical protein
LEILLAINENALNQSCDLDSETIDVRPKTEKLAMGVKKKWMVEQQISQILRIPRVRFLC